MLCCLSFSSLPQSEGVTLLGQLCGSSRGVAGMMTNQLEGADYDDEKAKKEGTRTHLTFPRVGVSGGGAGGG